MTSVWSAPLSRSDPVAGVAAPSVGDREAVDCAVLIVTYNSAAHVGALLASLPAAAAGLSFRTVVVDNGSTDGTIELLRGRQDVQLIESGTNLGYAGGSILPAGTPDRANPCWR